MLAPIAVRDVMESPVETVSPDASAREAARRLVDAGVGSLVVCRDDEPVGIVTEVDLTELLATGRDGGSTTVADVMSEPLTTVAADATIEDAASRMREEEIKHLPVVEGETLTGIVTTTDLSDYLPHLVGRSGVETREPERPSSRDVRADTAYENEDWDYEYLGDDGGIDVGEAARFSKTLSADDVEAFAEASGDTNRLHLDDEFASKTRFGERIAHGTLVAGLLSAALARLPGLIIYISQDLSFQGPVPLGERVTAECEVVEDLDGDRYRLSTAVRTDDTTVIDGEATVVADPLPE